MISGNTTDGVIVTSNSFNTAIQGFFQTYDGFQIPPLPNQEATGNTFTQNRIGTDANEQSALPNGTGIQFLGTTDDGNTLHVDNNVIGGGLTSTT